MIARRLHGRSVGEHQPAGGVLGGHAVGHAFEDGYELIAGTPHALGERCDPHRQRAAAGNHRDADRIGTDAHMSIPGRRSSSQRYRADPHQAGLARSETGSGEQRTQHEQSGECHSATHRGVHDRQGRFDP